MSDEGTQNEGTGAENAEGPKTYTQEEMDNITTAVRATERKTVTDKVGQINTLTEELAASKRLNESKSETASRESQESIQQDMDKKFDRLKKDLELKTKLTTAGYTEGNVNDFVKLAGEFESVEETFDGINTRYSGLLGKKTNIDGIGGRASNDEQHSLEYSPEYIQTELEKLPGANAKAAWLTRNKESIDAYREKHFPQGARRLKITMDDLGATKVHD